MNPRLVRLIYVLPFLGLILCSFFIASPLYTPWYNSDHAVQVLMTERFDWLNDWFYWGQDRLGSWVPFLGHLFHKIFGFNGIWAASLALYVSLTLGFYFFQFFIRHYGLKILFCLAYFMPLGLFENQVFLGHPYAGQLLFIGACFYSLFHLKRANSQGKVFAWGLLFGSSFVLSIWMSDISIILAPMYFLFFFLDQSEVKSDEKRMAWRIPKLKIKWGWYVFSILAAYLVFGKLLGLVKENSISDPRYIELFADKNEMEEGMTLLKTVLFNSFLFRIGNVLISFHTWFCGIALALGLFFNLKTYKIDTSLKAFLFVFTAFFVLRLTLLSNWVVTFHYEPRYFTFAYILFLFSLFYLWDKTEARFKKYGQFILAFAVIFSALHFIIRQNADLTHTKKEISYQKLVKETESLNECTLIGSYWHVYNLASTKPSKIIPIPQQGDFLRNKQDLKKAFAGKDIYFVAGKAFKYPDYTLQHGRILKKKGTVFQKKIYRYCAYEKSFRIPFLQMPVKENTFNFSGAYLKKDSLHFQSFYQTERFGLTKGNYGINLDISGLKGNDSATIIIWHEAKAKHFGVVALKNGLNQIRFGKNDFIHAAEIELKVNGSGEVKIKLGDLQKID